MILDCAQSIAHVPLNLAELGVDLAVFSAHKLYGPSGVGALIAKTEFLESAPILKTGGGMVEVVEDKTTTFMGLPQKYEPGSQNTANIVGLIAALDFIEQIGYDKIAEHEQSLKQQLFELFTLPEVKVLGSSQNRLGVVSFAVAGIHPHDLGQFLDERGVVVRTGHHCAQLIHRQFAIPSTTRASLGIYNTTEDVEQLISAVKQGIMFFK
jgi:cysteine desulfurase/selenocysteine lyase